MSDHMRETRAEAEAQARAHADDPSTVVEVVHPGFNADEVAGGFAFADDRGLIVHCFDGSRSAELCPDDPAERLARVDRAWAAARHRHRRLTLEEVSPFHRAAIAAIADGVASVRDLPPARRRDLLEADLPRADHLLVGLRRFVREPTVEAALGVLTRDDAMLDVPAEHHRAHPCPLCGRPAIGGQRYPTAVCDRCHDRATCSCGRVVRGRNTSLGGGFEAVHDDDGTICAQVTDDGRCRVGDAECRMSEAYMGGVVVVASPR